MVVTVSLAKIDSLRDSFTATATRPAGATWGVWDTSTLPAWVTPQRRDEGLALPAGRYRLEVLEGQPLVYENGANLGNPTPGVRVLDGTVALWSMMNSKCTVLVTRLA